MTKRPSLNLSSSKIIKMLDQLISRENKIYNFLIVQGDTLSAFCASYVAFNKGIKVCHLEAGLRSQNLNSPFPEEMYRRLISKIATLHFCPTRLNYLNLKKEGIKDNLSIIGNSIVDSLNLLKPEIIKNNQKYNFFFKRNYEFEPLNEKYILFTCHRRDNYGKRFEEICNSIKYVAKNFNIKIVYPLHLNPHFYKRAKKNLEDLTNVILIDNQKYLQMLYLIKNSLFIVSDSGGIQEEAPTFNKFVMVIRDYTERMESIKLGYSKLVEINSKTIISSISKLIENKDYLIKVKKNPYGDGNTAKLVFKEILKYQKNEENINF